eukprot:g45795.t1
MPGVNEQKRDSLILNALRPREAYCNWLNGVQITASVGNADGLLEQIKSPQVRKVIGILQVAKSRILKHWRKLDSNITDAANEAKDNVKYLYTLDKFFGPLMKCTP